MDVNKMFRVQNVEKVNYWSHRTLLYVHSLLHFIVYMIYNDVDLKEWFNYLFSWNAQIGKPQLGIQYRLSNGYFAVSRICMKP